MDVALKYSLWFSIVQSYFDHYMSYIKLGPGYLNFTLISIPNS